VTASTAVAVKRCLLSSAAEYVKANVGAWQGRKSDIAVDQKGFTCQCCLQAPLRALSTALYYMQHQHDYFLMPDC
jgi:hypothetical protein